MVKRTIQFISAEWGICAFFSLSIMLLAFVFQLEEVNGLVKIFLFVGGLYLFVGFLAASGRIIQGIPVANPYKYILLGKDKGGYDFVILLFFFGAIFLILKGPYFILQITMAKKIEVLLSTLGNAVLLLNLVILVLYSAYKIALYSAISILFFYKKEVLDSFKGGIKGIVGFKSLIFLLIIFDIFYAFIGYIQYYEVRVLISLTAHLVPSFIILLMFSHFQIEKENAVQQDGNIVISQQSA